MRKITGVVDAVAAQALHHLEAVDVRHRDVEHDEIGCRRRDLGQRLAPVGGGLDVEADEPQPDRDEIGDVVLVVDDQDPQTLWIDRQAHVRQHRIRP